MRVAVFPLAIPYLLNPVGIVTLVTLSAEANSATTFALVVGLLGVVGAIDVAVFRGANRMSDHIDESRMLITKKVFASCWPRSPSNSCSTDYRASARSSCRFTDPAAKRRLVTTGQARNTTDAYSVDSKYPTCLGLPGASAVG